MILCQTWSGIFAKWTKVIWHELLPTQAWRVEPPPAFKTTMKYFHISVWRACVIWRVNSFIRWTSKPIHFCVESVTDVDENLGEQLERCSLFYLVCLPQRSAIIEGVSVKLYRATYLTHYWPNGHVFPSEYRLEYSFNGTGCWSHIRDRIRHCVRTSPKCDWPSYLNCELIRFVHRLPPKYCSRLTISNALRRRNDGRYSSCFGPTSTGACSLYAKHVTFRSSLSVTNTSRHNIIVSTVNSAARWTTNLG